MRAARELGTVVRQHLRANLRTRFALAFAAVAAVVAAMVGLLGYHAASERIYQEIDTSLDPRPPPWRAGRPTCRPRRLRRAAVSGAVNHVRSSRSW